MAALVTALGLLAAPAVARDQLGEVASAGPGPEAYDHVLVHKMGPRHADRVLVLMPGTLGGAGDFTLLGRALTKRVDDLQVWAVDRRSQALEETVVFEQALAGERTPLEAFDHYLGWLTNGGVPADHYRFLDVATVPFAREWGMRTALDDARRVVRAAGARRARGAPRRALARRLADGRVRGLGLPRQARLPRSRRAGPDRRWPSRQLRRLRPRPGAGADRRACDLEPVRRPARERGGRVRAGLFAEIGGLFARLAPTASAAPLQAFSLLPAAFKPAQTVTNRGLLGLRVRSRQLAAASRPARQRRRAGDGGDPLDWVDGGLTPVSRLARTFGQEPSNSVEWFFPKRLTIDTNGADAMRMNDVARFLGLRLEHTKRIDVPIYAFQTDLTDGDVLRGAERLVRRAKTTWGESLLVDGAPRQSHLDPLTATPERNEFLHTLIDFLGAVD